MLKRELHDTILTFQHFIASHESRIVAAILVDY